MSLSAQIFLFYFLPLTLAIHWLAPQRHRNLVLLLASLVFYAWSNPYFVGLILFTVTVDFICGLVMTGALGRNRSGEVPLLAADQPRSRLQRAALLVSLISDLSLLGFFKYFNFGVENLNAVLSLFGLDALRLGHGFHVILPLGISFYTFKSMTCSIDIYYGRARGTRSFIDYACFVTLFPQLAAGPIMRWVQAEPQMRARKVTLERFGHGVIFFSLGLAKKVLFANPCGTIADTVFAAGSLDALSAWVGALAFTFQIYFDFSGYSDMAVGVGHMLGFDFPLNFNAPYRSHSITEFWRRWHMTLSLWFRDYLFLPVAYASGRRLERFQLTARREDLASYAAGAMVTMLLCGLWHGAAWTFIVWGGLLGAALVVERAIGKTSWYRRTPRAVKIVITFVLITLGWVVFRSDSLGAAGHYLESMIGLGGGTSQAKLVSAILFRPYYLLTLAAAGMVVWQGRTTQTFAAVLTPLRATIALAVFVLALMVMFQQSFSPFLYSGF
ncbi:MAG: MBOAT family O-acyltransferase [Acidobacteriota bacterium]